ncbi:MAG: cytochrome c4 [Gammaproteobacteria bacterium]|nr:cytochrome c4 [Gammaproteobacteria bacterium]
MKIKLAPLFATVGLALTAGPIQAESLVDGSAEAGKTKAITCTACHGPEGNSANAMWPNIAGQNAPYIQAQLAAFKSGSRMDPVMSSQAMLLSDEDMADLAVYFESLPAAAQAVADADSVSRGEALYRGGNTTTGVSACMACHGPTGHGNPAAKYPALQGQHAVYTAKQLNDYASGARTTDGKTRIMRDIAGRLSKEDIAALSSYVQGLR